MHWSKRLYLINLWLFAVEKFIFYTLDENYVKYKKNARKERCEKFIIMHLYIHYCILGW